MENDQSDRISRLLLEIDLLKRRIEEQKKENDDLRQKIRELLTNGA